MNRPSSCRITLSPSSAILIFWSSVSSFNAGTIAPSPKEVTCSNVRAPVFGFRFASFSALRCAAFSSRSAFFAALSASRFNFSAAFWASFASLASRFFSSVACFLSSFFDGRFSVAEGAPSRICLIASALLLPFFFFVAITPSPSFLFWSLTVRLFIALLDVSILLKDVSMGYLITLHVFHLDTSRVAITDPFHQLKCLIRHSVALYGNQLSPTHRAKLSVNQALFIPIPQHTIAFSWYWRLEYFHHFKMPCISTVFVVTEYSFALR